MATVTKSIGTSSRDYSTITLWEADLDNVAEYSSGDDAVGECYNDSVFDESVTINGGNTVGLNSITLTAASGERHDGTAGTGARVVRTSNGLFVTISGANSIDYEISWLEFDANGNECSIATRAAANNTVANIVLHGWDGTDNSAELLVAQGSVNSNYTNCIIYDLTQGFSGASGAACLMRQSFDGINVYNCTLHDVSDASGNATACLILSDRSDENCRNVICTGATNTGSGSATDFSPASPTNATMDYNMSSDTSASGANSITSVTVADQYVSTVSGSEDLHLKTGSDAIGAGVDLGTSPTNVNIDINGRDRDAEGDTWDIGAHQFVAGGGGALTLDADHGTFTLTGQTVDLSASRSLAAGLGSFALTGQTVDLITSGALAAEAGSFLLTGQDVDLRADRTLSVEHANFVLNGQDVNLVGENTIVAENGVFTVTGQVVGFAQALSLVAEHADFVLTGQDANLSLGFTLDAEHGVFVLNGQNVVLTYDTGVFERRVRAFIIG
ncbi:MAG: hypothetical protein AAGD43_16290 [Pseudomonadota bacterium]